MNYIQALSIFGLTMEDVMKYSLMDLMNHYVNLKSKLDFDDEEELMDLNDAYSILMDDIKSRNKKEIDVQEKVGEVGIEVNVKKLNYTEINGLEATIKGGLKGKIQFLYNKMSSFFNTENDPEEMIITNKKIQEKSTVLGCTKNGDLFSITFKG